MNDTQKDINSLFVTNNFIYKAQSSEFPHNNSNNNNDLIYIYIGFSSKELLSDMIAHTLQQAYTESPLTQLGSEIIVKNIDQLYPHNIVPLMSLDDMLNDITHVNSSGS